MSRKFDPDHPELMDRPQPVSEELRVDLTNLESLNRRFGAYKIIRRFLKPYLSPGGNCTVADLCTASGDIPRLAVDLARSIGCQIHIDAVDFQSSTVAIARDRSQEYPEIKYHVANALTWEPPEKPDIVLCSLALHHFSEDDATALLRHIRKLALRGALVADLRRGWLTTAGIYAATLLLYREPMTVADARDSARRAFSFSEMSDLARRAGWRDFTASKRPFGRQELIWKYPH